MVFNYIQKKRGFSSVHTGVGYYNSKREPMLFIHNRDMASEHALRVKTIFKDSQGYVYRLT